MILSATSKNFKLKTAKKLGNKLHPQINIFICSKKGIRSN